jgi:hypothetical protein
VAGEATKVSSKHGRSKKPAASDVTLSLGPSSDPNQRLLRFDIAPRYTGAADCTAGHTYLQDAAARERARAEALADLTGQARDAVVANAMAAWNGAKGPVWYGEVFDGKEATPAPTRSPRVDPRPLKNPRATPKAQKATDGDAAATDARDIDSVGASGDANAPALAPDAASTEEPPSL